MAKHEQQTEAETPKNPLAKVEELLQTLVDVKKDDMHKHTTEILEALDFLAESLTGKKDLISTNLRTRSGLGQNFILADSDGDQRTFGSITNLDKLYYLLHSNTLRQSLLIPLEWGGIFIKITFDTDLKMATFYLMGVNQNDSVYKRFIKILGDLEKQE